MTTKAATHPSGLAQAITAAGVHLAPADVTSFGPADHPNGIHAGELIRFNRTGRFALNTCGLIVSVPQQWARTHATASEQTHHPLAVQP